MDTASSGTGVRAFCDKLVERMNGRVSTCQVTQTGRKVSRMYFCEYRIKEIKWTQSWHLVTMPRFP